MYSNKENSYFPTFFPRKSPYTRPNSENMDPIVGKILNRPRTSDNNFGRNHTPVQQFRMKNSNGQFFPNPNEPSTSFVHQNFREYDNNSNQNTKTRKGNETAHFRPRKSLLGNKTPRVNFDSSMESKTINSNVVSEVTDNSKIAKSTGNIQETPAKSFQMKPRQNLLHLFTGSVENLTHWYKLKNSLHILFEVTATIISFQPGNRKTEKCFWLSDSKLGPKLQVVFYEIDRPLPKLRIDSLVTCVGRLITRNRLQAYKIEQSSEAEKSDLERLSFICNRVADEMASAIYKK